MAAVIRAVSLAALLAALGSQAAPADEPLVIESRGGVKITYRAVPVSRTTNFPIRCNLIQN
jgi:hypothetical protein